MNKITPLSPAVASAPARTLPSRTRLQPPALSEFCHCASWTVDPELRLTEAERDRFVDCLRAAEGYCSIHVLAYSVTLTDFEVLLEIPPTSPGLDTAEALMDHLKRSAVGADRVANVKRFLARYRSEGDAPGEQDYVNTYTRRLRNHNRFIKLLVDQFTEGFNRTRSRAGKVWAAPGWWTPVEDTADTLLGMATFIDLNPVRAGLAGRSEDYRWCGYGEAVAGKEPAGAAVRYLIRRKFERDENLTEALELYRRRLAQRRMELRHFSGLG